MGFLRMIPNSANSLQFRKLYIPLTMQTKRTIIPAGTPGTFRPEWGQFPEADARIIVWIAHKGKTIEESGYGHCMNMLPWRNAYAWSYAPIAPPVDGLEAFKQGWVAIETHWHQCLVGGSGFRYRYGDLTRIDAIGRFCELIGTFPTLAAAQEAAYAHFLSTLND